jgi:hypothetical protein
MPAELKVRPTPFCPPRRVMILLFLYINYFDLGEQYIYQLCNFLLGYDDLFSFNPEMEVPC